MNNPALLEAIKMAQMGKQLNNTLSFAQKMAEATKAYAGLGEQFIGLKDIGKLAQTINRKVANKSHYFLNKGDIYMNNKAALTPCISSNHLPFVNLVANCVEK